MKKRELGFVGGVVIGGVMLLTLLVCPSQMRVQITNDQLYEGVSVTKQDVRVETASWLGLWKETKDVDVKNVDDEEIIVSTGWLSRHFDLDKIPVSYLVAKYDGIEYQYDDPKLKATDFQVQAVYADKHVEDVPKDAMTVHTDGLSTEDVMSVKVEAFGESCDVMVRPVLVAGVIGSYDGGLKVGETFDKSKLKVSVKFADGATRTLDDWSCDFEGSVSADTKIEVVSKKYGKGVVTVDTSNIKDYQLDYRKSVYEGDVLQPQDIAFTVVFEDGKETAVEDLTFDEFTVFKGTKVSMKSSLLGTISCVVNPIGVEKVVADTVATMNRELVVQKLTLVYTDGHKRPLDMSDVKFVTDLKKPLKRGQNQIVFQWKNHEYQFSVLMM